MAFLSLAISQPALAQCAPGVFSCTVPAGAYNSNINLGGGPSNTLSLALEPGVIVNNPGGDAVNAANSTGPSPFFADVTLTANNANITNTSLPAGDNNTGLRIQSAGSATITASGPIAVAGTASDWAILDIVQNGSPGTSGTAMVTYGQPSAPGLGLTVGTVAAPGGVESGGIQADNRGTGDAIINASGNIRGFAGASGFYGLIAHSGDTESTPGGPFAGNANVSYHFGTIDVSADRPRGILVWSQGDGSGTVTTDPGTTIITRSPNPGNNGGPAVYVYLGSATAANGRALTATVGSEIMTFGATTTDSSNKPYGIEATSVVDAPISVNYTGLGITTEGGNGIGINAISGSGSIDVGSSGPITTNGSGALGILADSGTIVNQTQFDMILPPGPGGPITITASGKITTQGAESHGIWASSTTGAVQVSATNVSTTGEFSTAINATSPGLAPAPVGAASIPSGAPPFNVRPTGTGPVSAGLRTAGIGTITIPGGNVTVNIAPGGSIMGGWQATPFSLSNPSAPDTTGPIYGLPAAGVILSSAGGTAILTNDGSIGALSDLAIAGDPQVTNNGIITGFVQFTGDNSNILNNGTFNLRHFADTNGDSVRDTNRVAIADLGTGPNNSFTNNGTLALAALPTTPTPIIDSTGEYLPLGNPKNTMALGGPLQGQLIGTAAFTNSGTIDLQANPVPGDVLMITGGRGGSTPGTGGGGTFISNGGLLKLDTVLNEGGAATHSDTLVVDSTLVAGGATKTFIRNFGGGGALTVGDGILVVQVLDPNRSSQERAFRLGAAAEAGGFEYLLFRGGVGANAANGNYYLRSDIIVPPVVTPPPGTVTPPPGTVTPPIVVIPPEDLPPALEDEAGPIELPPSAQPGAEIPFYRPGAALYSAVPGVARDMALEILSTFHERAGEQFLVNGYGINGNGWLPATWARGFGTHLDQSWSGTVSPRFDGTKFGFQAGFDVFRFESFPGHRDYVGLFGGYSNANGDVDGQLIGVRSINVGTLSMTAGHVGGYWTHIGPGEWYLDTVAMGSFYDATPQSITGDSAHLKGNGFTGSVEAGYPIPLPIPVSGSWRIEPQVQAIYQTLGFNHANDVASSVNFNTNGSFVIRGGLRLMDTLQLQSGAQLQPYARVNVWHTAHATDSIVLDTDTIGVAQAASSIEFGGGAVAKLNQNLGVWAYASAATSISDQRLHIFGGTVGLRYTFGAAPPPIGPVPVAAPAPTPVRTYLVFFDWDKATLTDRARQIIAEASAASTHVQLTRILVNGYTDTSGTARYNQGLSVRRAEAVAAELVRDDVPREVISIHGFGETHLLVPTGQGVREPQNRRVEIVLQ